MSNIRTPEEKEKIVKDYLNGKGIKTIEKEYQVRNAQVYRWLEKYEKYGIDGLKSKTGKHKNHVAGLYFRKPKSKIEELELELMKMKPQDLWSRSHHQLVLFGRYICKARGPECSNCAFYDDCTSKDKKKRN